MKDKSKYINGGIGVIMAVLTTVIIIILISALSNNSKNDDLKTQVNNSKNQTEITLESTFYTNSNTTEILKTEINDESCINSEESNITVKKDGTDKTNNTESANFENQQTTKKEIKETTNKNFEENTQRITVNNTQPVFSDTSPTTVKETPTEKRKEFKCQIAIYCKTILSNMDKLNESKKQYVPSDGVILEKIEVTVYENETVFDVLKRVCKEKNIPVDSMGGTTFEPAYVRGINNIFEFDCTNTSGWKYCINGQYPSYSCDKYVLKSNDVIIWNYTCTMNDL